MPTVSTNVAVILLRYMTTNDRRKTYSAKNRDCNMWLTMSAYFTVIDVGEPM